MEFEVRLGGADIIRAIIYSHMRNKAIWAMCILSSTIANGVSAIELWVMGWPLQESAVVAGDIVIWILGLFFVGLSLTIILLVVSPGWRKGRFGIHNIEVNQKGIVESTEHNRSEIYWPSIRSVSSKHSGLYFLHSGADSFVIPRRNFVSEESWHEFERLFLSYYESGRVR